MSLVTVFIAFTPIKVDCPPVDRTFYWVEDLRKLRGRPRWAHDPKPISSRPLRGFAYPKQLGCSHLKKVSGAWIVAFGGGGPGVQPGPPISSPGRRLSLGATRRSLSTDGMPVTPYGAWFLHLTKLLTRLLLSRSRSSTRATGNRRARSRPKACTFGSSTCWGAEHLRSKTAAVRKARWRSGLRSLRPTASKRNHRRCLQVTELLATRETAA